MLKRWHSLVLVALVASAAGFIPSWPFRSAGAQTIGLVAAYSFNEGAGTILNDLSGNSNTGAISGATWSTSGKYGNALSFNGSNSWVTVNGSASLDLTTGMTLEAWVKPTAAQSGWRAILLKERPGGLCYGLYGFDDTSKPPAVYINTGSSSDVSAGGSAVLPLNAWSHVAGSYDGATLRLYVNGQLVSSRAVSGAMVTSGGALRIGGDAVWGEYFVGLIDEVRVYSRALSQGEIQTDMNTPIP